MELQVRAYWQAELPRPGKWWSSLCPWLPSYVVPSSSRFVREAPGRSVQIILSGLPTMLVGFEPGLGSWKVILSHTDFRSISPHLWLITARRQVEVDLVGDCWDA